MIEIITCDSGDWYVLKVDGEIYYEGHQIPTHIWLELLKEEFGVSYKEYCISDEDMEYRIFEGEDCL